MAINEKISLLLRILVENNRKLYATELSGKFGISPMDIVQLMRKYNHVYFNVDEELRISLTDEGRLFASRSLSNLGNKPICDECGNTFSEQVSRTQIDMWEPYVPGKKFRDAYKRTKERTKETSS